MLDSDLDVDPHRRSSSVSWTRAKRRGTGTGPVGAP